MWNYGRDGENVVPGVPLALSFFGISVNPIPIKGAGSITTGTPNFFHLLLDLWGARASAFVTTNFLAWHNNI